MDAGAVIPGTILGFFLDRFVLGGRVFDRVARVLLPRYKVRPVTVGRKEQADRLLTLLTGRPHDGGVQTRLVFVWAVATPAQASINAKSDKRPSGALT